MKKTSLAILLNHYRFEFLLLALVLVLFDKAFFANDFFFTRVLWPTNMILLGITSWAIFREKLPWLRALRNTFVLLTVIIALAFPLIVQSIWLTEFSFMVYILYYSLIFVEVLRQIFNRSETNLSVIFGSICGFLLLIFVAQFAFLQIEFTQPGAFTGLKPGGIPFLYNQLSYFSMVTMATVGYGDITPANTSARLITMFFSLAGQFYMVALVGIIVSRYSPSINNK